MLAAVDRHAEAQVIFEADEQWLAPFSASRTGILLIGTRDNIRRLDLAHPGSAEVG